MFETASRIGQATAMTPYHLSHLDENIVIIPSAKGHEETPLLITEELADLLKTLTPQAPRGWDLVPENIRIFGYASKDGPRSAWSTACTRADIDDLTPHEAGRHGFATETFTRNGVDLKACTEYGRWKDSSLFLNVYAHSEDSENKVLSVMSTNPVQEKDKEK